MSARTYGGSLARSFLAMCLASSPAVYAASIINIQNVDPTGVGFNDPTPVAPVGGNVGVTLGQQRLIAFQTAASVWGATLNSVPEITVMADWEALSCTETTAVLGGAGALQVWRDFPNAPVPNTWFSEAEANALSGTNLSGDAQISAHFNVNLGAPNCLEGTFFYLGLDHNAGTNIDLVTVLTHEFGHGLGFQTYTDGSTGKELSDSRLGPLPSIWDRFLLDNTTNKLWSEMTNRERKASALNGRHLVWTGPNVTFNIPSVLALGSPALAITRPSSVAGFYAVGTADFGPPLTEAGVTAEVMPAVDDAGNTDACTTISGSNAGAIAGKLAFLDRGNCNFTVKVKNAQDAGALGVIVADNAAGSPPAGLEGTDDTIIIPSVRITQDDGNTLRAALAGHGPLHSGVVANLGLNSRLYSGADYMQRAKLYAPDPYAGGSSVSHFDTLEFPNQLMEPFINGDLTGAVTPPADLTFPLLKDIGWNP